MKDLSLIKKLTMLRAAFQAVLLVAAKTSEEEEIALEVQHTADASQLLDHQMESLIGRFKV